MATLSTPIPDELVADIVLSIAPHLMQSADAAVRSAATKATSGAPTTDAEKILLGQAFTKDALKESLLDYRSQQAAAAARVNKSDPAVTW